ncbi:ATP-grasp domain-containing protein [Pleionea sp. CnH1-48]|uniref:ATP-grasp domain-containing protein n=1 Tax=Pleionea sp. CnH1-48 TaxID=2954494 RepID=UPI0020976EE3|nr:ATP-grasp domain-containing protein [Pleionea sp. CnH1-48]MCO7226180.1 ATP-grasp domain-containing protein [Pleionea sp. CnH1-48]
MINKAYIQTKGNNKFRHEEQLVVSELGVRGISFDVFTEKRINRRNLPLDINTLVVGDMNCIYGALKQLNIEIPEANTYPKSLRKYLYRDVFESTIGDLEYHLRNGTGPLFAKPANKQKVFTGRVFETEQDLYYIQGISRRQKVYCTKPVNFISEFRVYIVDSEIRCIDL